MRLFIICGVSPIKTPSPNPRWGPGRETPKDSVTVAKIVKVSSLIRRERTRPLATYNE